MQEISGTRVGVVGTGVMGGHHTRVASMLPGCTLVGIFDTDAAHAEHVAQQYNITAFRSCEALCAAVEAVIIATPTSTHAAVAELCLQAGCHVLVEKPIAATAYEAEKLVGLHRKTDRVLMIGHVERFNPAVSTLMTALENEEIIAAEAVRLSPTAGRDQSADVIFDLMIHDIDLALACTRSLPIKVEAVGHRVRGPLIDHASALVQFASGATFALLASMVSQERTRKVRVLTRTAQFTVDCASREVWVQRMGTSTVQGPEARPYPAALVEQLTVPARDPLAQEQEHFLQAIRTSSEPMTSAEMGLQAVRMAEMIQERIGEPVVTGNV
ncbi:MAG: Gfo/Idh/MocA family protein [Armatimonadota bacterium]